MKRFIISHQFVLILLLATRAFAQDESSPGSRIEPTPASKSFLQTNCMDCHDSQTEEGGFNLENLKDITASNFSNWKRVWEQVATKQMPPESDLPALERYQFDAWLLKQLKTIDPRFDDEQSPGKGNYVDHDLIFGDQVVPDLAPPSTPARLWRIHPDAYLVRIEDLVNKQMSYDPDKPGLLTRGDVPVFPSGVEDTGSKRVSAGSDHAYGYFNGSEWTKRLANIYAPFSVSDGHTLRNYAHLYSISSPEIMQLTQNARSVLTYLMHGPPKHQIVSLTKDQAKKAGSSGWIMYRPDFQRKENPLAGIIKRNKADASDLRFAIEYLFQHLVCRPPTESELREYTNNLQESIEVFGLDDGLKIGLTPIFLHTETLFNTELVNEGKPDNHGRVMLAGQELAKALFGAFSYLPPDDVMQKALAEGKLKTRRDIEKQVDRILRDPSIRKPRLLNFFREYFDYYRSVDVCKTAEDRAKLGDKRGDTLYKRAVVRQAAHVDRMIELILEKDSKVLYELLTTDRFIFAIPDDLEKVKPHVRPYNYGTDFLLGLDKKGDYSSFSDAEKIHVREHFSHSGPYQSKGIRRISEVPNRMGILTHPSWLIAHSTAMENHAIHRGIWIRRKLLGGAIPDIPITVDAMLPEEPDSTLRHRMRVTAETQCARCHRNVDSLGFPFERFNHLGIYRELEQGEPVDTTGAIVGSGVPGLDGPVKGPYELIEKLANTEKVHQVFVRYAFRYWMGRNETVHDASVIRAAYKAYQDNDGSMNALVRALLLSDSFLYRTISK